MQSFQIENAKSVQGWQLKWKGNTYVLCRGKVIIGPMKFWFVYLCVFYGFWIFLSAISAMYDVLDETYHGFCYFLFWTLAIIEVILYYLTAFTDPGVLLKN